MRVLICGQKKFGLEVLKICEAMPGIEIAGVVTPSEDRALQTYALNKGYSWWPPTCLEFVDPVHLGITAHFFGKIPSNSIRKAAFGWLGYHPSLLPRHRGRSAIDWALKMKDVITGGTLYWLNDAMDKGDIAYQDWIFLDYKKSAKQIWEEELLPMGLRLFNNALIDISRAVIRRKPQEQFAKFATYEPGMGPAAPTLQ